MNNYNMNENLYKKILRNFEIEIKENKNGFSKLNEIEYKNNKKIVSLEDLIKNFEGYYDIDKFNNINKNLCIFYNGNPDLTIQILFQCLINNCRAKLIMTNLCYGINKLLVSLFTEILKDYRLYNIIEFENFDNMGKIDQQESKYDEFLFIGDLNLFNLSTINENKKKFIPSESTLIYCVDEDMQELEQKIIEYGVENNIVIEVCDSLKKERFIEFANESLEYCTVLILSNNKDEIDFIKNNIKNKKVIVNKNPFKEKISVNLF